MVLQRKALFSSRNFCSAALLRAFCEVGEINRPSLPSEKPTALRGHAPENFVTKSTEASWFTVCDHFCDRLAERAAFPIDERANGGGTFSVSFW